MPPLPSARRLPDPIVRVMKVCPNCRRMFRVEFNYDYAWHYVHEELTCPYRFDIAGNCKRVVMNQIRAVYRLAPARVRGDIGGERPEDEA